MQHVNWWSCNYIHTALHLIISLEILTSNLFSIIKSNCASKSNFPLKEESWWCLQWRTTCNFLHKSDSQSYKKISYEMIRTKDKMFLSLWPDSLYTQVTGTEGLFIRIISTSHALTDWACIENNTSNRL